MKDFLFTSALVVPLLMSSVALAGTFFPRSLEQEKYVIAGVSLETGTPPFNPNTSAYSVTLNIVKGLNRCEARQSNPQISAAEGLTTPSPLNIRVDNAFALPQGSCTEEFQPVFQEVKGYLIKDNDQPFVVDTNTEEFGRLTFMENPSNTMISPRSFKVLEVSDLATPFPGTGWRVGTFEIEAYMGANSCFAGHNTARGYTYLLDGTLHIGVELIKEREGFCIELFMPVYQTIRFQGAFKKGAVRALEFENTDHDGATERVYKVPDLLR